MKKKTIAMCLAVVLCCGQYTPAGADTIDQVKEQQAQTNSKLHDVEQQVDSLEAQKNQLLGEIDSLDAQLIQTIASINGLKDSIANTEVEIGRTQAELVLAEEDRAEQYAAMKKRIQYLYENGGNISWITVLLADGSISDMLESANRTQELYDYDKKALDEYIAVVEQISNLELELQAEKADLEQMKRAQEEEQQNLEVVLAQMRATCSDYDAQIAAAEAKAAQYQQLIKDQNERIQELIEEQQRQAEEEERKRREEEERKRQEEEEKRRQEEEAKKPTPTPTKKPTQAPTQAPTETPDDSDSGNSGSSYEKGQKIVDYACRFIGNPYVYGGNSLTNGIDCSAFVQQVYRHFGYKLPRTSASQRSVGRAVSITNAQPGDIVCYDGHVAIYMEGGGIVHASNSAPYPVGGIKISPTAAYRTILTIRRVVS